jgi:CheY-like chemotaxis protein
MIPIAPSILITDDDLPFRETVRSVLDTLGVRTLVAADGQETLDIVRCQDVHLLLVDMHMPRLTGLETIRQVRQFQHRLPFILMSAKADEDVIREALTLDAFSVLFKPVSRFDLTTTVERALARTYDGWKRRSPPLGGGEPSSS